MRDNQASLDAYISKIVIQLSPAELKKGFVDLTWNEELTCSICLCGGVLQPVKCGHCDKLFCGECLKVWSQTGHNFCPLCKNHPIQEAPLNKIVQAFI